LLPDNNNARQDILEQIENLGGFPEPFLSGKKTFSTRWSTTYGRQLIKEDLRDATLIRQIDQVELLYELLPSKIGSPLSYENLSNDIQTSGPTIKNWIDTFESLFILFRVSPWTTKISRAITREQKFYFFNPSIIDSAGSRLENLVAIELLRATSSWNDKGLGNFSLHYLRNKDKDEVDFLVANNRKPLFMVEVKHGNPDITASTIKFQNMLKIPAIVLTGKPGVWQMRTNMDRKFYSSAPAIGLLVCRNHNGIVKKCFWSNIQISRPYNRTIFNMCLHKKSGILQICKWSFLQQWSHIKDSHFTVLKFQ
jgi:predicted AAA+ superfamily ATPase